MIEDRMMNTLMMILYFFKKASIVNILCKGREEVDLVMPGFVNLKKGKFRQWGYF